jgi:ribose 5-phosphate isomerase B
MSGSTTPLVIGSDHAAYDLKEKIKAFLVEQSIDVEDVGCFSENSVDYPDYGIKVASLVSSGKFSRGILLCGTGIGMSMVANKFSHVRAALCSDLFSAIMSRRHNDSNILVLGGRVIGDVLALEIVRVWLETPFEGGRHLRRLAKFDRLDTDAKHGCTDGSVSD